MIKISKNGWIVYNENGAIVTIDVHNRDDSRNVNKLKDFERESILDDEYDNSDYILSWSVWNNKSNLTDEQFKKNFDKKLNLRDFATLKYKTSIFNRKLENFFVVAGELLEPSHDEQIIDTVHNIICSHFDENAECYQYRYQPSGFTYCTREQAKNVLKTFEKLEMMSEESNGKEQSTGE